MSNDSTAVTVPSLETLIQELKAQPGYTTMLNNISNSEERVALENQVLRLMENYYTAVLKPLVS